MQTIIKKHDYTAKDKAIHRIKVLDAEKDWEVIIRRYRKPRSNAQLAYFWGGVVQTVVEETGNDKNDIHDFLCGEYFGWQECEMFGAKRKKPIRTLTSPEPLTVEEMVNFCEWCASRMAQENIIIPPPHEVNYGF